MRNLAHRERHGWGVFRPGREALMCLPRRNMTPNPGWHQPVERSEAAGLPADGPNPAGWREPGEDTRADDADGPYNVRGWLGFRPVTGEGARRQPPLDQRCGGPDCIGSGRQSLRWQLRSPRATEPCWPRLHCLSSGSGRRGNLQRPGSTPITVSAFRPIVDPIGRMDSRTRPDRGPRSLRW